MRSSLCRVCQLPTFAVLGVIFALSACAPQAGTTPGQSGTTTAPPVEPADYTTETNHFQSLQRAALGGDYLAFAEHLKAQDAQVVVAQLQQSFGGRPFDVYTAKSQTNATVHKRVVELRGTGARLYLFLELEKVPGGWNVGTYQIERDRRRIVTRL